jgi:hypothetical protein
MFKKNYRHLQPALISNVKDLPEKQQEILEASWLGVFYRALSSAEDCLQPINEPLYSQVHWR